MEERHPPPKSGTLEPCVAGAIVVENRRALEELVGPEAIAAGLRHTPPEAREEYEGAMAVSWVRLSTVEAVFQAVAREAGWEMAALHAQVARVGVERTLKTFWRMLLRFTSDEALMSRTPVIYAKAYNRGRLVTAIKSPGRAQVELLDWPGAPDWPIRGTAAGIESVLRLSGRRDVKVAVERTVTGATYVATWRA